MYGVAKWCENSSSLHYIILYTCTPTPNVLSIVTIVRYDLIKITTSKKSTIDY